MEMIAIVIRFILMQIKLLCHFEILFPLEIVNVTLSAGIRCFTRIYYSK